MTSRLLLGLFALLVISAVAQADPKADEAVVAQHAIRQLAPLVRETVLVEKGTATAAIVSADGPMWNDAAQSIQATIAEKTGVTLPIVAPDQLGERDWAQRSLIVLGNLSASPVFARLYNNFFVCADEAYTGRGGYELRTVHDPWGLGHNVIALGAQDAAGLTAGVDRLSAIIEKDAARGRLVVERLLLLDLRAEGRRAPLLPRLSAADIADERKKIDAVAEKAGAGRTAAYNAVEYAMRYHRTGDEGWFELFRHALERQLDYYATDDYINQEGPRRYDRDFRDSWAFRLIVAWDLLEEHPGWSDAERLRITNHMLRLVFECNMKNGWDSPAAIARWMNYDSLPNNHQTWPALANLFGGWYFSRHYHLPIADTWLEIAQHLFHSASRSAKAWEDAAGYDWIVPRHLLMYAFASGDRTFIEQGQAAAIGQSLLMSVDSLGRQPAWGDCEFIDATDEMPELVCALEYALHDGRFRWLAERIAGPPTGDAYSWLRDSASRRLAGARGELQQPYWTSVAAVAPSGEAGLNVSYLPRPHYDLLGNLPGRAEFPAPNLPYEQTFDKLVLRGGWDPADDYLMLDGYAAGSHGHFDGNAIISFTAAGAHWLVDGEYTRRMPKYHCSVTVLRDGSSGTMPPNVALDEAAWFGSGALTRTTMPHYNGVTWTRNIIHVAKGYTAVIDELTAEKAGDYDLMCSWRVLGDAILKGDTLELRQPGKGFALRNLTGQRQELVFVRNSGHHTYWRGPGFPIYQLYQRTSRHLEAGETVRFINVFAADARGVPAIDAWQAGEGRGAIRIDGNLELFGTGGLAGGITTDARVYRISPDTAWLAGATGCAVGQRTWFAAPTPTSVRLDARGLALGQAEAVPVPGLRPVEVMGAARPTPEAFDASAALPVLGHHQPAATDRRTDPLAGAKSLPVRWRYQDGAPPAEQPDGGPRYTALTAIDLANDGRPDALIGTGAGTVIAVGNEGRERWRVRVGAPVIVLAAGRLREGSAPLVFYSTDDAVFGVLDAHGRELARVEPPSFRNVRSRVRNITLADLDGDGVAEIVIGCDSWQYMVYQLTSADGGRRELKLDWKSVFYAHAATVCHVADFNGDGRPEIVAGNEYVSLQVMDTAGKIIRERSGFGKEQTAIASVDFTGEGYRTALLGTDEGTVTAFDLNLPRGSRPAADAGTGSGTAVRMLWTRNVGDRVTGFCQAGTGPESHVLVASESGTIWALDKDGGIVWRRDLGDPVKCLRQVGGDYLALTARHVVLLARDGRPLASATMSGPPVALALDHGTAFVLTEEGTLDALVPQ